MSFDPNSSRTPARGFVADTMSFDEGLRRHMIGVYNNMMLGLVTTGLLAWAVTHSSLINLLYAPVNGQLHSTPLNYLFMFAPIGFVLVLSFGLNRLSSVAARALFFAYSATVGVSLASIFLRYQDQSIATIFFTSAATFGGMSLYGYTTKTDLTRFGSFLIMGLFGIIIAGIVNIFLHSSALQLIGSVIGVIIFTGLTAYDTQKIRNSYSANYGVETNAKLAIWGALSLYLDFLNLFLSLLQLFGRRR